MGRQEIVGVLGSIIVFCVIVFFVLRCSRKLLPKKITQIRSETWTIPKAVSILNKPRNVFDEDAFALREKAYDFILDEHKRQLDSLKLPDTCIPCENDLTPVEILFLWYINGKSVFSPHIAPYWMIDYHVFCYQNLIQKLINSKCLTVIEPYDSLQYLKSEQLKSILDDYAIPSKGKKAELVERIQCNFSPSIINDLCRDSYMYKATPLGETIIGDNEIYILYHRGKSKQLGLSIDDIEFVNKLFPNATARNKEEMACLMVQDARARHYISEGCTLRQNVMEHPEWDIKSLWIN